MNCYQPHISFQAIMVNNRLWAMIDNGQWQTMGNDRQWVMADNGQ